MNKTKNVMVRVTEEEYNIIKAKAQKIGLSISAFLRMLALKNSEDA